MADQAWGTGVGRHRLQHRREPVTLEERRREQDTRLVSGLADDEVTLVIEGYREGLTASAVSRATGLPYGRVCAVFHVLREMEADDASTR